MIDVSNERTTQQGNAVTTGLLQTLNRNTAYIALSFADDGVLESELDFVFPNDDTQAAILYVLAHGLITALVNDAKGIRDLGMEAILAMGEGEGKDLN